METQSLVDLVGRKLTKVEQIENLGLVFYFEDGAKAVFYHQQSCCECVTLTDVNGCWDDLLGHPLLVADERSEWSGASLVGSETWTFYTFRSVGGSVDVRWHGSSNGYYSESVDLLFVPPNSKSAEASFDALMKCLQSGWAYGA